MPDRPGHHPRRSLVERTQRLFHRACMGEPCERTPVWLMRQAGRYMQEYRDLRARYSFLTSATSRSWRAEVTIHAREVLGVDALFCSPTSC